jgi:hypothetical protein
MKNEPKNPRIGFWCLSLLAALVAYPVSFGPACWISERTEDGRILSAFYGPISPSFIHKTLFSSR